jgi:N-acetylmuramoyl-L-alanine amidase
MAYCSIAAMKYRIAALCSLGLLVLGAPPAWAVKVARLTVNSQGERTQVVIDFDAPFGDPALFSLDGPPRLILDVPELVAKSGSVQPGNGALKSFRFGQPSPGTGRIVLDLAGPAQVNETRTFDPDGSNGTYRLMLDIRTISQENFAAATRSGKRKLPGSLAVAQSRPQTRPESLPSSKIDPVKIDQAKIDQAKIDPGKAEPLPPKPEPTIPTAPPPPPQTINVPEVRPMVAEKIRGRLPIVVIDAGHGGQDPGAPSIMKGRHEKEAVLAVAKAIKAELDASGKVKAILTRSTDIFIPLGGRAEIARAAGADLFMSIHADSISKPEIRGATVYTLSQTASDKEAEKLAEKENKADIITGINLGGESPDVTSILIDLTQRETMNYSAEFAQVAVREMSSKVYFRSNFHRFAGFVVLKAPDVPSVLIETGYMSNEDDSKFLFSPEGQKSIAVGVRKAVERYFERRIEK